jgi:hypothetical protein
MALLAAHCWLLPLLHRVRVCVCACPWLPLGRFLYDVTYQYVTGLLCLAACANLMVRPAIGAFGPKALPKK